jgi:hypothetical protein
MTRENERKIPEVLCPFYERECPLGERTALICWRRMRSDDAVFPDYEEFEADCEIARWMFSAGNGRFN